MAKAEVVWVAEQTYIGIDSTGHSLVISKPGEGSVGVKPSDLLLVAVAACANVDVVEIIKKRRATLHKLIVRVSGEQAPEPPWAFRTIHLHFEIEANNLDAPQAERAIDLALNKYCSVRSSLSPDVAVSFECTVRTPESAGELPRIASD
ncbi:MAG: OsmC family protein [Anaerolineae bacterium]|nr:OsmC family protein [Thermoflexales bacterium]MDW8408233.1 OsmC family protein [Anaerolineae bacterium]